MNNATKIDLPLDTRDAMAALLNASLADAIDLGTQAKQAHWNVKGPSFIALHQLFDTVHGLADGFTDMIAERVVALGGTAQGTLSMVVAGTQLPVYPTSITSGPDHLTALSTALAGFGGRVRAAIDAADEAGDKSTADLFTEISRETDKQLWFLEAHLQSDR